MTDTTDTAAEPTFDAPLITAEEAAGRAAAGALVVDVRSDAGRARDGVIPAPSAATATTSTRSSSSTRPRSSPRSPTGTRTSSSCAARSTVPAPSPSSSARRDSRTSPMSTAASPPGRSRVRRPRRRPQSSDALTWHDGCFDPPSEEGSKHPSFRHAVRRIRSVTRAEKYSASTGTRSSAAWNCAKTSKSRGTRSGTNP